MREIKFRGKHREDGNWIYGSLIDWGNHEQLFIFPLLENASSLPFETFLTMKVKPVDNKTVGQYTGLVDKNGVEIYEGDIVCAKYADELISIGDIQFDCGVFGVEWTFNKQHKQMIGSWGQRHNLRRLDDDFIDNIEVISNIYDNPELLEVEE